jgi:hypothetical protein
MRNEGSYDYVKPQLLDRLIQSEEIISFYRDSGAVFLGLDTIRSSQKTPYVGAERRVAALTSTGRKCFLDN